MVLYLFIYLFCFHIVSDFLCVVIIYSGFFFIIITSPRSNPTPASHRNIVSYRKRWSRCVTHYITSHRNARPRPAPSRPNLPTLPTPCHLHLNFLSPNSQHYQKKSSSQLLYRILCLAFVYCYDAILYYFFFIRVSEWPCLVLSLPATRYRTSR